MRSILMILTLITFCISNDAWDLYKKWDNFPIMMHFFRIDKDGNYNLRFYDTYTIFNDSSMNLISLSTPVTESEDFVDLDLIQDDSLAWLNYRRDGGSNPTSMRYNLNSGEYNEYYIGDSLNLGYDMILAMWAAPNGDVWGELSDSGAVHYIKSEDRWELFNEQNSPLNTGFPRFFEFDSAGRVWMAFDDGSRADLKGGVAVYDNGEWKHFDRYTTPLPANALTQIKFTNDGWTWLATDSGLAKFHYEEDRWEVVDFSSLMPGDLNPQVLDFHLGEDGTIGALVWNKDMIEYENAAFLFYDGTTWTKFQAHEDISVLNDNDRFCRTRKLFLDTSGNYWFDSDSSGLLMFDKTSKIFTATNASNSQIPGCDYLPTKRVNNIYIKGITKNNIMWFEYIYSGPEHYISKFDITNNTMEFYSEFTTGLTDDTVTTVTVTQSGEKWFSFFHKDDFFSYYHVSRYKDVPGLNDWFSMSSYKYYPYDELPATTIVDNIQVDNESTVWASSSEYGSPLSYYKDSIWTIIEADTATIPSTQIYDMKITTDGTLWFATAKGMARFKNDQWTNWDVDNGLPSSITTGIAFDNDTVWIATEKGAAKFDGTAWTTVDTSAGLPSNYIYDVEVDSEGNKWFTSKDEGLIKYDGTQWQSNLDELPVTPIKKIYADKTGKIWTHGGTNSAFGAAKFDGETWTIYDTENSELPSNKVTGIAFDKDGSKWFSTYGGGVAHLNDGDSIPVANSGKVISPMKRKTTLTAGNNKINFSLADNSPVKVQLFDLRGRMVLEKNMGTLNSGNHSLLLKQNISRGFYIVKMVTPKQSIQAKMMVQ